MSRDAHDDPPPVLDYRAPDPSGSRSPAQTGTAVAAFAKGSLAAGFVIMTATALASGRITGDTPTLEALALVIPPVFSTVIGSSTLAVTLAIRRWRLRGRMRTRPRWICGLLGLIYALATLGLVVNVLPLLTGFASDRALSVGLFVFMATLGPVLSFFVTERTE